MSLNDTGELGNIFKLKYTHAVFFLKYSSVI